VSRNPVVERADTYRAIAIVPTVHSSFPARQSTSCPACGKSFSYDVHSTGTYLYTQVDAMLEERFCVGRRYGFLWLRRCKFTEPHMHQKCKRCGAHWVSAPHSDARYA
jgi:ribosomal protein S27AE